jgi:threonine dehydratase
MAPAVTLDDVRAAAAALAEGGTVRCTPCTASETLSEITGARIWCKWENLQYTASFKERGARWFLLGMDAAARDRGVVAASAGNHAQGVARHAALLGITATIVMPATTPFSKVTQTEHLGARVVLTGQHFGDARAEGVVLTGQHFGDARAEAQVLAREHGLTFVPAFDDSRIIAGQGTVALEVLDQAPDIDTLVVPIGGGGLISGCATVVKARRPDVRVIGVQSETHPEFAAALGARVERVDAPSCAEGIAVKQPGELTLEIARELVDDVVVVREETIERAIGLYLEIEKSVVEGAGAASLAAVLAEPERFAGRKDALVVSGGNIDLRMLSAVILRALARTGRLVRFRLEVPDVPGRLAAVAHTIGDGGGNIVDVEHHRDRPGLPLREAILEVSVETRDAAHADAIEVALRGLGMAVARAEPGASS